MIIPTIVVKAHISRSIEDRDMVLIYYFLPKCVMRKSKKRLRSLALSGSRFIPGTEKNVFLRDHILVSQRVGAGKG
jgi:hypothetical protein